MSSKLEPDNQTSVSTHFRFQLATWMQWIHLQTAPGLATLQHKTNLILYGRLEEGMEEVEGCLAPEGDSYNTVRDPTSLTSPATSVNRRGI